ncbi:MAG: beta strand repeat-containing protein, partial [Pirellulaceae bacterium]
MVIDLSSGNAIPSGGIQFVGGESAFDNDRLTVTGYSMNTADGVADVTVNHTGTESGNVVLSGLGTIAFSEIEPLALAGTAADLVINLPNTANPDVVLSDDGGAADPDATNNAGASAIDGSTFEFTQFTNPTNTLTINGGTNNDAISVQGLDAAYAAGLIIQGGAGGTNSVTFQTAATNLGGGALTVGTLNTINSIAVNASVTASGATLTSQAGGISFNAAGALNVGAGTATLTATGGSITGIATGAAKIIAGTLNLTVTGAGNDIGTSAAAPLEINAVTLNASTAGAAGDDIFIDDMAGGLAAGLITAGAGNVDLDVLGGSLTSAAGDAGVADIVGNVVTLDVTGAGSDIGASTTARLEVNANSLNGSTAGAAGDDMFLLETNGLTALNLNAGAGIINLLVQGPVADADTGDDLAAADLILDVAGGIGVAGTPINTNVARADIRNTVAGGIFVTDTAGGLTLTQLGGANGNAVDGLGGNGEIRANSPLTIAANAITAGGMTYTAADGAAAGDNLTVNAGITVQDTTAALVMNGGDNITFDTASVVRAFTTLTINGDTGGAVDAAGSDINLFGTVRSDTLGIAVNGNVQSDTITVDDNGPAAGGTVAGVVTSAGNGVTINGFGGTDTLNLQDFTDATPDLFSIRATTLSEDFGDNFFDGMSPGDGLTYAGLEVINIQTSNIAGGANGDTVTVFDLNPGTAYNLDGNDPTTLPGDTLNIAPAGPINVYEVAGNYVFELGGSLNVQEFETINLFPGDGVVNIIGDEGQGTAGGGAGTDEADGVFVAGTGPNSGRLLLTHAGVPIAAPPVISFLFTNTLNIRTFDQDDDVTLDPFADNTIGGWGVQVQVDGGADGANGDDIQYGNAAFLAGYDAAPDGSRSGVSERVVLAPTTTTGAGQIRSTNATDGTNILTATFVGTEDVSFFFNDGSAGDTDSLELITTGLGETIAVNLTNAGDDTGAWIDLDLTAPATQLLQVERAVRASANAGLNATQSPLAAISIQAGDGDDVFNVTPRADAGSPLAPTTMNLDAGHPSASDVINVAGTANADDSYANTAGAAPGAGSLVVTLAASPTTIINYSATETIAIQGGGGTGQDTLTLNGTGGPDAFTLTGTGAGAGTTRTNAGPTITFAGFGSTSSDLELNGQGGDDSFAITQVSNWAMDQIRVNGGSPAASDKLVIQGAAGSTDQMRLAPTGAGAGSISRPLGATTVFTGIEHVAVVLQNDTNDNFTVDGTAGDDHYYITSGLQKGETHIRGTMNQPGGTFELPQIDVTGNSLSVLGTYNFNGAGGTDRLTLTGTDRNDQFDPERVTATSGLIEHRVNGVQTNFIGIANFATVILDGLIGDDTFNVPGDLPFAVNVHGGEPSSGSDVLNMAGSGGAVALDLAAQTITETNAISYTGVETVNIDANAALTVTGTPDNDNFQVTPLNADHDGRFTHDRTPSVAFGYTDATSVTFAGGPGGDDVLSVLGDEAADAVAAGANTVTVDGSTVTAGPGIDELSVSGLGGNDNIVLTGFTTAIRVTARGGEGNDTLVGSPNADVFYGGIGDDVLVGGANNDILYGEDGNDRFGDPAGRDPAANDAGNDLFVGGSGSDQFFWDPGDGDDVVEGGAGDADQILFFGSAGAEQFSLYADVADASRFHLFRNLGSIDVVASDVEEVTLATGGGSDAVSVGRDLVSNTLTNLQTTGLRVIDVDLGADGANDTVTVEGRSTDDQMHASLNAGIVTVAGLGFDVRLTGPDAAITDTLILAGNDGNDTIVVGNGVETQFDLVLNGSAGRDTLDTSATLASAGTTIALNGGDGNDQLIGGAGNETKDGGAGDDTFVGNGGTDAIGAGLPDAVGDRILVPGTPGPDAIVLALNAAGHLLVTINGITTTYTNFVAGPIATSGIDLVLVQGGLGNDVLTVDSANGAIPVAIEFYGGGGLDGLVLQGGTAVSDDYFPGPNPGQGVSVIDIGGVVQTVTFAEIEPLLDLVVGPLTVNATPADNAINYGPGVGQGNGLVSIDNFETIEFSNKTTLTINALAGRDTINIANPTTPNGLTGITVDGGDPGAGDVLVITGTVNAEAFEYAPTGGSNAGSVLIAGLPTVAFDGVSGVTIDGRSTTGDDTLAVRSEAGFDTVSLTPGATLDGGTIQIKATAGTESTPPLTFLGLGQDATLTLLSGNAGNREDEFEYFGTAVSDTFGVTNAGQINLNGQIAVLANGASRLVLRGLDGSDVINLAGGHPFAAGVRVDGGSPGAGSDTLNLTGAAGVAEAAVIRPDAAIPSEQDIVGFGVATIDVTGVELITVTAQAADGDSLNVELGDGDNRARVERGSDVGTLNADLVTSDSLPAIQFAGESRFRITAGPGNGAGADVVTFATWFLAGATNTNYEFDGGVSDLLIIEGVDSALGGNDDFTVSNPAGANPFAISDLHGTTPTVTVVNATLGRVQINALGGDDEVIINLAGLDLVTIPITFDGGTNADTLTVTGAPNQGATVGNYSPGPAAGQGRLTHVAGGLTMTVDILNLEPVIDLVPGTLTVNGTDLANTIDYRANGANGLVSVDEFETIEFNNKTNVTLNGGAGSDQFHIAGTNAGFTGTLFINGDSPVLGGDTLTVTGVAATLTVDHAAGTLAGALNAAAQLIGYGTVEQIRINAGAIQRLAMTGSSNYEIVPGAEADQGEVLSAGIPVSFDGLGGASFLRLTGDGQGFATVHGTAGNDLITVERLGGFDTVTTAGRPTIETAALPVLIVDGHAGDDSFVVNGSAAFTYAQVQLNGGDGDDQDTLFANTPALGVTVDLGLAAITGYGPAGMVINYTGLQSVVADAGGAVIDVVASAGDDDVTVTPADANSGSVELGNHAVQAGTVLLPTLDPVLFYTNTAGNAVRVDLAGGSDTLIVVGSTPGNRAAGQQQVFDIDMPNARVRIDDENNGVFDGTVTYFNNESLAVYGLEGDDDFNVRVYPAVIVGGDQRIPLFVDGGDPIGQTAGDRINLNANGNGMVAETGPENDEGGFQVAANSRISFDHIEAATVNNSPCAIIMGTNGDDDITIIARNELANPAQFVGANGQQDFTSSVNAGVEILWLNVSDLYIDALSGDDDTVIRAPAPDGVAAALDWDVHVRIVGGPPSGVTGDQGDVIILETPGNAAFARDVIYTADGSDTGRLLLDEDNSGTYSAVSTDSLIEILNQFVVDCDGDGVNEYRSSPGGTEQLVYDAEGTNGNFTVFGNPLDIATNDAFVHTPGTAFDEGTFRNLNLLGIRYQNLGAGATIQVDGRTQLAGGSDVLFVDGTQFSDLFTVAATTSAVTLNGQLALTHANIEQLSLDGLDGDDSFVVNSPFAAGLTDVFVNGQGPGGSDSLTVVSNDAAIEAFAVALGTLPGDGNVQVNAVNTPYTGMEHVVLDGSDADTDNLTIADDSRDNVWTISGGPLVGGQLADRVQITGRESLDYVDFNNVTLNNQSGTDSFVVYPTNLGQFAGAFTVNGDAGAPTDDVLTLVGTPGNDTVTSPAVGPIVSVNGTRITAGANLAEIRVLTLDGNDNINLDLDLPGDDAVRKVIDAGAGNDIVDMLGSVDADIFGGLGDDTITGSPDADLIFGGPGNDILVGAGGIDTIYGEDGNDIFGNPALAANGVADDAGNDRFFGGAGSDTFIWEPGDGSDTIEGGSEEADALLFFGSAGAETFNIFAKLSDPSRAILFRSLGNITIDMAGIDQINVSGGAGVDRYVVGRANDGDAGDDVAPTSPYVDPTATLSDLSTTEVRVVNVTGAAADGDFVFVDGRPLDDNLLASVESAATGVVRVAGMPYDVRVIGATPADRLTIRGNEGLDVIKAHAGVEGLIGVTLAGGTGDDQLSADAILIGGPGDDFLEGGAGDDQLFGNQGEDTMIGLGGNDTFDGGADFDTILIPGTSGNDRIDVNQTAAATLVHVVNGVTETDTLALVAGVRTVERALVQAGEGDDIIRVQWADSLGQSAVIDSLRMDVEGGDDFTRDRLAVVDTGTGDLVLYRKGELDSTGSMTVGPAEDEPLEAVFQGIEYAEPVSGTDGRVIVFKHDPFEFYN